VSPAGQAGPHPVQVESEWQVPFAGGVGPEFLRSRAAQDQTGNRARLKECRKRMEPLQEALYASKQYSVLCIFQALDAAGKDGTIRRVFKGLNPTGLRVASFKRPTPVELQHDFLWRTTLDLPRDGEIGIFNRSYYEEVLTVQVHPEFLEGQYPAGVPDPDRLWPARYRAIREHERHLAMANTIVLKFWLQVSVEEQSRRFLDRITEADKRWKFSAHDVAEAGFREAYDEAVLRMLNETSRAWAPWFVIPADDKPYMRLQVADILHQALASLHLPYPQPDVHEDREMEEFAKQLRARLPH
jgi:PPK2 family polyphosphate:nucleotide phosphotransferase